MAGERDRYTEKEMASLTPAEREGLLDETLVDYDPRWEEDPMSLGAILRVLSNSGMGSPEGTTKTVEGAAFGPDASWASHLAWSKRRALDYLDRGDTRNAVSSMTSDLRKHPEGERLPPEIMVLGMMESRSGPDAVRRWIEGFN
jgi:hypothetical protein